MRSRRQEDTRNDEMSRSGYSDDWPDDNSGWLYRGAVASAIRGKRGQAFLRELIAVLDAMPAKRLINGELEITLNSPNPYHRQEHYGVCALGAVGQARGLDMSRLDPEDPDTVAAKFDIAPAMAREITYENDGEFEVRPETPEERWLRMRRWAEHHLAESAKQ